MEAPQETIQLIAQALKEQGIFTPEVLAYALATIEHETGGTFKPIEEYGGRSQARKLGYSGGENFFGRGYIQLTHDYNYKDIGQKIGLGDKLYRNPELALRPDIAAKILAVFFKERGVADYAKQGDFIGARKPVNGTDRAGQIAQRAQQYLGQVQNYQTGEQDSVKGGGLLDMIIPQAYAEEANMSLPTYDAPDYDYSKVYGLGQGLTPPPQFSDNPIAGVEAVQEEASSVKPFKRKYTKQYASSEDPTLARMAKTREKFSSDPLSGVKAVQSIAYNPKAQAKQAGAGMNYVVKKGDTLWNIAQAKLGSGTRWKEIQGYKGEPRQLPIGTKLTIPGKKAPVYSTPKPAPFKMPMENLMPKPTFSSNPFAGLKAVQAAANPLQQRQSVPMPTVNKSVNPAAGYQKVLQTANPVRQQYSTPVPQKSKTPTVDALFGTLNKLQGRK